MPRTHYLHFDHTAAIVEIPDNFSSDAWGAMQKAFARRIHPRVKDEDIWVDCFQLWPNCRRGPVYWDEELAGPGGMSYMLLPLPEATYAAIKACASYIRCNHDVVRLKALHPSSWITDFDPAPFATTSP